MNNRPKVLLLSLYFGFLMIMARFFYWQVIKTSDLRKQALSQTMKLEKQEPQRGNILYSDSHLMALNKSGIEVAIYKPNLKKNIYEVINRLEEIRPELKDEKKLNDFANNKDQKWLEVDGLFPSELKDELILLGLNTKIGWERQYPDNKYTKIITGFLAKNKNGVKVGYDGIEGYYDRQLKGRSGYYWSAVDAEGNRVLTHQGWSMEPKDGVDLITTIDRSIQYKMTNKLYEGVEKYSADSASGIVMESSTGRILAMVSVEKTSEASQSGNKNKTITDLFEPGSIFKPIVVAMALDSGRISKNFVCEKCDRSRVIGEYTIGNWDSSVHPNSDLKQIITNSDNIGMSYIIEKLGKEKFVEFFGKLNLEKKTGVDLQGESRAVKKEFVAEIDLATASFGQGFAVNQLQMLSAFNALADDGIWVAPKIIKAKIENGIVKDVKNDGEVQIFSKTSTDLTKEILKYAVENGTVSQFKPANLEVCAKSGTAQVAIKGEYVDTVTNASYIGFSPCKDPKFTMIITVNSPRTSPWGSSTAAPIWFELATEINRLL